MPQRPKPRGERTAQTRAVAMLAGRNLLPHKQQLVRMAAKLTVNFDNAVALLYYLGEVRQDDEPRVLLTRALDLSREVRELLARAFGDDQFAEGSDPLSVLMARGDGR